MSIARVLNAKGGVVGGGALLRGGRILTCAHVVDAAGGPQESVRVDFPLLQRGPLEARVIAWAAAGGFGSGDLALLELHEDPGLTPLRLVERPRAGALTLFGFPAGHPQGVWKVDIQMAGPLTGGWEQLVARGGDDYRFQRGFSGCPVLLDGAVVAVFAHADGDKSVDSGACIPAAVVARVLGEPLEVPADLAPELELPLRAGALPRVAEVDMYTAGVSRSKYVTRVNHDPAYVPRAIDDDLDAALDEPFILLAGDSKSGKSRSAFELLRRRLPDAAFVAPAGHPSAPARLAELGMPTAAERIVLWLDDIDRYLAPNGLDLRALAALAEHTPPVTVIATIQSQRRAKLLATDGDGARTARTVLESAHRVDLPLKPRPEERLAAERAYPDEDFSVHAIGEVLVAGPEMQRRYRDAREGEPAGWAVLQAAVDWRRAGLERPVPRDALRELFAAYLFEATPELDPSEEAFGAGLAWARTRVAGTLALLQPESADAFVAFDYVVALADGEHQPGILAATWALVLDRSAGDERLAVAFEAFTRDERELAKRAATRAWEADANPWAAVLLGDLEDEDGNEDAAITWFELAIASGHEAVVPVAQTDLGALHRRRGDYDRARELFEAALASGAPDVVERAEAGVRRALLERTSSAGVHGVHAAISATGWTVAPLAQASLAALLLGDVGPDHQRATELLEAALASGDPRAVPLAQANLAVALAGSSDRAQRERARTLLEQAEASGQPRVAAVAKVNLAIMAWQAGQLDLERLEEARACGDVRIARLADGFLGGILARGDANDRERARELLEAAAASPASDVAVLARVNLAELLAEAGEAERAAALIDAALAAVPLAPIAQANLGSVLVRRGGADAERGTELLEAALVSGDPFARALACANLGGILAQAGRDLERGRELLEEAVATLVDADVLAFVQANLSALLLQADPERARALAEAALTSRNPQVVGLAQLNLGALLMDAGDRARARTLLEAALDAPLPHIALYAHANLAQLLSEGDEDDVAAARGLLQHLIDSGDAYHAPIAQAKLALISTDDAERRALLTAAAAGGVPEATAMANALLGALLLDLGELDAAEAALNAAIAGDQPSWSAAAQYCLAEIHAARRRDAAEPQDARSGS